MEKNKKLKKIITNSTKVNLFVNKALSASRIFLR